MSIRHMRYMRNNLEGVVPRTELYPVKKIIGFNQAMLDAIEKWRAKQRPIPNLSDAIRALIEAGLKASREK